MYSEQFVFKIGEVVYLKVDPEQNPKMITGILIRENETIYEVSGHEDNASWRYSFELSETRDVIRATSN